MKPFPMAVRTIFLGVALGCLSWSLPARSAERFTLELPSRELSGTLDEAAIVRIAAPFAEGESELSEAAESAFLTDLLRLQKGLPRSGPILVAIEHRSGDAEAAELSYRRLKWLRSAIISKQSAFSTDRVVIAVFPRGSQPAQTEILMLPVELDLASDAAQDGGLRAVALDSAFMGPVFVRLASADDAAVVSPAPALPPTPAPPAPAPAEPVATADEQAPAPALPPVETADEPVPPPAPPAPTVAYRSVWCPAPSRPLDDFYPGGPIVPCGRTP